MLVLCASYFDVQYFDEKLRDMPLITHVRGMKMHEMISRMASMETGAIMLTVAWEGYNIVANDGTRRGLLDSVVISRLPFSAPRPMQLETLQTIFGEQKASSINWSNMRNEVVRRVYQGICRLVRGPDDKGEILIMDPRFPPNGVIRQMLPQLAPRPGHKDIIKAIPSRFAHRRHYDVRVHA
jgi:Rad3-related DNA helicase